MTKEVVAALTDFGSDSSNNTKVTVCLGTRVRGKPNLLIYRLQLTDELASIFLKMAVETLQGISEDLDYGNRTLEKYEAGNVPDKHEIEYHVPAADSTPGQVIRSLTTLHQLSVFDGNDKVINQLAFHIIAIEGAGRHPIYLFRRYSKTKEIGRSRKLATLFSKGTFDTIREPIFLFDNMVDCIYIAGHMLILNKDNYHRIFHFFDDAITHADQTLAIIHAAIPIINSDNFNKDCKSNALMLVRLRSISQREYFGNLEIGALIEKITTDDLPIEVREDGGVQKIVYDPLHKWKFMRLLDDGYLVSDLTGSRYEATSKHARA